MQLKLAIEILLLNIMLKIRQLIMTGMLFVFCCGCSVHQVTNAPSQAASQGASQTVGQVAGPRAGQMAGQAAGQAVALDQDAPYEMQAVTHQSSATVNSNYFTIQFLVNKKTMPEFQ
jgi:hypothetical protein